MRLEKTFSILYPTIQKTIQLETAILLMMVFLASVFILSDLFFGFFWLIFAVFAFLSFGLATLFPRAGLNALVFLTLIFERNFGLLPAILGRAEIKLYPLDILFAGILLGIFWQIANKEIQISQIKWQKTEIFLLIFLFLALVQFSIVLITKNGQLSPAFSSFKYYFFYPLFYFLPLFLINDSAQLKRFFQTVLTGGILIMPFIFFGLLNRGGLWTGFTPLSTEGFRLLGFSQAFYLCLIGLTLFLLLICQKIQKRPMVYLILGIWLLGIIGSLMRNLWLGLGLALVFSFFLVPENYKKNFLKIGEFFGLFCAFLLFLVIEISLLLPQNPITQEFSGLSRMTLARVQSLGDFSTDESAAWRFAAWSAVGKEFVKSPLLGLGFGKKIGVEIEQYSYRQFVDLREIHNSYLAILFQMGGVAFLIFLLFIFFSLKNAWKNKQNPFLRIVFLSLASNILVAIFFQPYLETNFLAIFFWLNFGLGKAFSVKNFAV